MIDKLKYDCLKPINYSVYSNDLCGDTLQDLLSNMIATINLTVDDVNEYSVVVDGLIEYVKGEGLSLEVQKQLNIWLEDGTIDRIINQEIFGDLSDRVNALNNDFTKLSSKFDEYKLSIDNKLNDTLQEVDRKINELLNNVNNIVNQLKSELEPIKKRIQLLEESQPINMVAKGCDNTGIEDCSTIITSVISEMVNSKKCRVLFFPSGVYRINQTINVRMKGIRLQIEGEGHGEEGANITTLLGGLETGVLFNVVEGREVIFKNIRVSGRESSEIAYKPGTTCFKVQASLQLYGCHIDGFDNISLWDGGYYHKFYNCFFQWFNIGFNRYPGYNLNFDLCKTFDFKTFAYVTGGNGPFTVNQCSFERFLGPVFSGYQSNYSNLNIDNSYFENYPNKPTRVPFAEVTGATGKYDNATIIDGAFGAIKLIGNSFNVGGIKRIIDLTYGTETCKSITSISNVIFYTKLTGDCFDIYCKTNGKVRTFLMRDMAHQVKIEEGGEKSVEYVNGITLNKYPVPGCVDIYNPFTNKNIEVFSGVKANAPTNNAISGSMYYASDLKKYIVWNEVDRKWTDMTGKDV